MLSQRLHKRSSKIVRKTLQYKGSDSVSMSVTAPRMRLISPARQASFSVLAQVEKGAFASDSLLALGKTLEARDAALASTIVFGSLRYQAQLDYLIRTYSRRDPATLDSPVLIALRAAIYQLRYLDRIPPHAAVNESVEWVKGKARAAAGLTNAVLRKVSRQAIRWPSEATELSCPEWLLQSWRSQFGPGVAHEIALAALQEPGQYVRVARGSFAGAEWQPTTVENCFRVEGPAPDGARLQDIGSQSIIPLLNLQPGLTYLDLCAAPGNKTLQALETTLGLTVACDISFRRVRQIPPICPRLVLDASHALPFQQQFDRIFVDAPCSGTGTLGRNPEIKWRLEAEDLARFAERQVQILRNALHVLAVGGRLVYATCSLQSEENDEVVRKAMETASPGHRLIQEIWRLPGRDEGDGFYAAVIERGPGTC